MSELIDNIMAVMDRAFDPCFGEAWTRKQVTDSLDLPNTHCIVVGADGQPTSDKAEPVGFLLSRAAPGEEELLLIGVIPEYRDLGLGTVLVKRFLKCAQERGADHVFLEMRHNNPAMSFYKRNGFEPIGKRPNYYRASNGERLDAITFSKKL